MGIGENIKKLRTARNLTQSELAVLLGVSDKTVSSWEINRTEPKIEMIEKLSTALNCSTKDLLDSHKISLKLHNNTGEYLLELYQKDPTFQRLAAMYLRLDAYNRRLAEKLVEQLDSRSEDC